MRQEGKETMRVVEIETQERERCYVVIDEVGIEARPDQRDTITPRQRSRIQGFVTLVDKIFSSQEELDAGKQPEIKIYTANGVFTGFIPITQPMVDTWMNIALDLVNGFSAIPAIQTVAFSYLHTKGEALKAARVARQQHSEQEIFNLNQLFETGRDEPI
jgi:hypothetical protein